MRRRRNARAAEVHQFAPTLGYRDAVGNHMLETQRAFAEAGMPGRIWVERAHPEVARRAEPYGGYGRGRDRSRRVLLYQASTGSDGIVDFLLARPEPKALYYHNITPARFFEPYDPITAAGLEKGRCDLERLAPAVDRAMANSEFSARDLRRLGIEDVRVVPPYPAPMLEAPSDQHARWLRETKRGIDVLFVGRVAPSKGHLQLLRVFAALRGGIDPAARMFVVGAWDPGLYMREIQTVRERLGSEGVVFTGSVADPHLAAHYREADVFLCLSEHEGYGVPLIEAMRSGLAVIAFDAGAVAETMGGAGVLIRTRDPFVVSEIVARVATDAELRASVIKRQFERVAELDASPRDEAIVEHVASALTEA